MNESTLEGKADALKTMFATISANGLGPIFSNLNETLTALVREGLKIQIEDLARPWPLRMGDLLIDGDEWPHRVREMARKLFRSRAYRGGWKRYGQWRRIRRELNRCDVELQAKLNRTLFQEEPSMLEKLTRELAEMGAP